MKNDSWVYFATCEGFTKIGISRYPWTRIGEGKTLNPFPVKLYHYFYVGNNHWLEKELHEIFKSQKHRDEWFIISEKELEEIKEFFNTGNVHNPQKLSKSQFKYFIKKYKEIKIKSKPEEVPINKK